MEKITLLPSSFVKYNQPEEFARAMDSLNELAIIEILSEGLNTSIIEVLTHFGNDKWGDELKKLQKVIAL